MIAIKNLSTAKPYSEFSKFYQDALNKNQLNVEAIVISSFNPIKKEVESRYVNLKYITNEEWIFFSNYNSKKATDFKMHEQVSILLYWNSINVQIRMKANIQKTKDEFSNQHFNSRSKEKNALAISSDQSSIIDSYELVKTNFQNTLNSSDQLYKRPSYWGGYSFSPYYFEFWQGHESRLNKRDVYEMQSNEWLRYKLQP